MLFCVTNATDINNSFCPQSLIYMIYIRVLVKFENVIP